MQSGKAIIPMLNYIRNNMKKLILLIAIGISTIVGVNAQIVQTHTLQSMLEQLGFSKSDVAELIITNQYTSKHNGVTHVYFRQAYNGIEVFNGVGNVNFKDGKAFGLNQTFVKNIKEQAQYLQTSVDPATALYNTAQNLNVSLPKAVTKTSLKLENNKTAFVDESLSPEPIQIQLYYVIIDGELKLAYNTNWLEKSTNNWWNVRVDAQSGTVLDKNSWSTNCTNHVHEVMKSTKSFKVQKTQTTPVLTKTGNRGTYNAFPLHVESPNHGERKLLINPADSVASPYGWHDTDGVEGEEYTITRGNNVYASDDKRAQNIPGYSPDGGSNLLFDYAYKEDTTSVSYNLNAAITNLFVWNNFMHDVMYHYGFDELAGNFQANNYGRGGVQGDYVQADAQDGSGTNNANFTAPPDGTKPRMQMYLWNNSKVNSALFMYASDSALTDSTPYAIAAFSTKDFNINNAPLQLFRSTANSSNGCSSSADSLHGKVALIERSGNCQYPVRARNAQNAGAIAVIVINNANSIVTMTGSNSSDITIPVIMIKKSYGDTLKQRLLADSVFVNISSEPQYPLFDSDLDNGVISHEYGHGISIRLTGGAANSNCLSNNEQAGEGWSDFFALYMTHSSTENETAGRGIGTWLNYENPSDLGIRPFKYSTNMTTNPYTYNSIKTAAIPHGVGAVWCTMLNDLYWKLIEKYGYDSNLHTGTGGNNRCLQLVIDGLKLQPCNPGFVDARNAILSADKLNNNGADTALIWEVFARRGLGYSAKQGSTSLTTDGTEAFDLPPVVSTGLQALNSLSEMAIWPNPNNGNFYFQFPKGANTVNIEIMDMAGKIVYANQIKGEDGATLENLNLQNGIYIIRASHQNKIFTSKLIISSVYNR